MPGAALAPGATVPLPAPTLRHLRTVLRRGPGSPLVVGDARGTTVDAVLEADVARCTGTPTTAAPPDPALHAWQAVGRGGRSEEAVRAVTEIGVDAVALVAAERSVRALDDRARRKLRDRCDAVARSAAEQSLRPWVPTVAGPLALADLLARTADDVQVLVAHVGAPGLGSVEVAPTTRCVVVAVGPEGGWTDDEVATARAQGASVVGLGDAVLRTEHAALAACAVVSARLGRMG